MNQQKWLLIATVLSCSEITYSKCYVYALGMKTGRHAQSSQRTRLNWEKQISDWIKT